MVWTTPRTWTPQEQVTASLLNTHLRDNLMTFQTWTSWTPVFATTGGSGGHVHQLGRYMQAGKLVIAQFTVQSSGVAASGDWAITLPVNARQIGTSGLTMLGHIVRLSATGVRVTSTGMLYATTNNLLGMVDEGQSTYLAGAIPLNARVDGNLMYEAA